MDLHYKQQLLLNVKRALDIAGMRLRTFDMNLDPLSQKHGEHDPITRSDVLATEAITKVLELSHLSSTIVTDLDADRKIDYTKPVWFVNALDGGKHYGPNNPDFSVNIALYMDGNLQLAAVYKPIREETFVAIRGEGARYSNGNFERMRVSRTNVLHRAILLTRLPTTEIRTLDTVVDSLPCNRIPASSVGNKLTQIAIGHADAHVNTNPRAGKCGTAAPQLILEEAGGKVTDIYGKRLNYEQDGNAWNDSFVASNSYLHEQLLKAIERSR